MRRCRRRCGPSCRKCRRSCSRPHRPTSGRARPSRRTRWTPSLGDLHPQVRLLLGAAEQHNAAPPARLGGRRGAAGALSQ
ncbi:hypothetical protein STCU_11347 [Strigomonas culicis]|uniref:Uncharacterized protein n=1 Tax=Strigomonas culicis TaxID=28005 RepID=S9TJ13_9TRYP|nr:hypothetical protein STCU_11347 [Strigomonas culicis]|eukprot:EPY16373.1 hypothetical protein STCU_11347 [Strigomonas culicis]